MNFHEINFLQYKCTCLCYSKFVIIRVNSWLNLLRNSNLPIAGGAGRRLQLDYHQCDIVGLLKAHLKAVQFVVDGFDNLISGLLRIFANDFSKPQFAEHFAIAVAGLPYAVCADGDNLPRVQACFQILLIYKILIHA